MKCCNNLRFNTANLEELERAQKFQQVERIREMICRRIAEKQVGWKHVPKWDAYYKEFDEIKQRYPFFVLEGQTKTAKTSWAAARLGDTKKVFYVNAASGNEPDLRKFDYFQHRIILYDEAPPNMVIQQKLLFQAPPVWVKLGQSTTNCYSYDVFVSGVMMIICSNKWTEEKSHMKIEDREWLEENSYFYNTKNEPLYERKS